MIILIPSFPSEVISSFYEIFLFLSKLMGLGIQDELLLGWEPYGDVIIILIVMASPAQAYRLLQESQ